MILAIFFIFLGFICGFYYLLGQQKLRFDLLLASIWLIAIGISQLHLSPLEKSWSFNFWILLLSFGLIFEITYNLGNKIWNNFLKDKKTNFSFGPSFLFIIIYLTLTALIANSYIFWRFGTLPLLSTIPDKMRFIINKEIFGPIEYAALLPRIYIPLSFLYLIVNKPVKKIYFNLIIINIILGLIILLFYASRLTIVITLLLCYFGYLAIKIKKLSTKKILLASFITVLIIFLISITIPTLRQFITYKDYQYEGEYNPFTYISTISQVNLPPTLQFLIPLYLIPTFNLQALMRATEFYKGATFYGAYSLSVFNSLLKLIHLPQFLATIEWDKIFVPWWNTATFIFNYFVDFGWIGIWLAAALWGLGLSFIYIWNNKRQSLLTAFILSYFSFVSIMTIYTNYFSREELYLDLTLILFIFSLLKF